MKFTFDVAVKTVVTYPALMKSVRGRKCVVLFTTRNTGMELTEEGFRESESGWIEADDIGVWQPFTGTIEVKP